MILYEIARTKYAIFVVLHDVGPEDSSLEFHFSKFEIDFLKLACKKL